MIFPGIFRAFLILAARKTFKTTSQDNIARQHRKTTSQDNIARQH